MPPNIASDNPVTRTQYLAGKIFEEQIYYNEMDNMIELTALSSSSKKLRMLCCLTSALFFLDDVNVCGVQPVHSFHMVLN